MEKILIIQTAFPGDAILTLPMIQKLSEKYENSKIDVISIPATRDIFARSPYINDVIVLDKRKNQKKISALLKFTRELKKEGYTRIYSPHRSFRSSLITMMLNVRETYGFSNSSFSYVYKYLVKYETERHEVQRNYDLIGFSYDEESWRVRPEMSATNEEKQKVAKYMKQITGKRKFAAVAPGSVWKTKIYPFEYYIEVIKYLLSREFDILLVGGDKDKDICDRLAETNKEHVKSTAGLFSIPESIEMLKSAEILISNDSAPTHMGVTSDIPVLTIYCSTISRFGFYPYNLKSKYISYDDLFCKPCGIHGYNECPIKTFDCGWNLKPETVYKSIEEILDDR